jgi:rod shape determining protein RodA
MSQSNPVENFCKQLWFKLKLDLPLLTGILLLSFFGLIILYSAGSASPDVISKQFGKLLLGLFILIICAHIPPHKYKVLAPWFFGIILMLLLFVLGLGAISKGAQRWLSLGLFRFQPAEIMKIAMPMMLGWYLDNKNLPPSFSTIMVCLILIIFPTILTALQPDLGTALIIFFSGIMVVFLSGIRWRNIILSLGCVAAIAPVLWHFLHTYQKNRVLTFLNPERDPLGSGYHIIQSKIALGSGGFFGKGWLHGTQAHLQFLPEHATDFIFSVGGEEFGFVGCLLLLSIFTYITGRMLYISMHADDTFSRLVSGGLTLTFFISFFVNIGMVSGILPVVGLPLPLVSFGGSSILVLMAIFGVISSFYTNKKLLIS